MSGVGSFATAAVETADVKEVTVNNSSKDPNHRTWNDERNGQGKFETVPGLESNLGGNGKGGEPDITAGQKMLAACSGSLFTSLLGIFSFFLPGSHN